MKIITQDEMIETLNNCLLQKSGYALIKYTKAVANYGVEDEPNIDYCRKNNIEIFDVKRKGGTFVVGAGDIAFGYVCQGVNSEVVSSLHDEYIEFLKSKGLNAEADGNDILVDGYKVFGWSSNYYPEYDATFSVCHFTINVNLELIRNICKKPMKKIPKGLSEYGITTKEIEQFVIDFANKIGA